MSALPNSWEKIKIGDYFEVVRGASPRPKGDPRYFGGNIPWISIRDINAQAGKYLLTTVEHVTPEGAEKSRLLPIGSLILSNSGSVCIPKILKVSGCIHDGFVAFPDIEKQCSPDYLYYMFDWMRPYVIRNNRQGVTQVNLNLDIVRNFEIPFPPLSEQKRIADKLDTLLEQVDACRTRLDKIPGMMKRFRQAVLAAATSGKLTEDWRTENEESAWNPKTIADVAQVGTGSTPLRSNPEFFAETGTAWVTSAATSKSLVISADEFVTPTAIAAHRLKLYPVGTLLVAMYGEGKTRGQVTELGIPATINQACAAIVVSQEKAIPAYVKLILQANYFEMRQLAEGGNQPNLNLSKVKDFSFSLPSLAEQAEIIRRVETLFAFADRLEARYTSARAQVEQLTPALLAKAFRGELVEQDPEDEPASALLARIAQARPVPTSKRKKS